MKTNLGGMLALALLGLACSGKSELVGGGGGSTSFAGSGGTNDGGAAGASNEVCPSIAPQPGTPCSYVGAGYCIYPVGTCGSSLFQCVGGAWAQFSPGDGAAYTCLNYQDGAWGMPKDGDSCACRGALDCTFNQCATAGQVHAVCDNTSWHVTTTPCVDKPCGTEGLACKAGEVCMLGGGLGAKYACAPDPCAALDQTTSCECAGMLCSSYEICSFHGDVLRCDCPICG